MKSTTRLVALLSGLGVLLCAAGVDSARAQQSHIGNLTGHAGAGSKLYQRYCVGCHGADGDGAEIGRAHV